MTHADFRSIHPSAPDLSREPCDCPGELAPGPVYHDQVDGHEVRIYRCVACERTVVHDATADRIRNDYPDSRRQARDLAGRALSR
jgi:hypothetical protein